MADTTPVEDKPQRTLADILTEVVEHLDLSPVHRAELLDAIGLLGAPSKPAPPPVYSPRQPSASAAA